MHMMLYEASMRWVMTYSAPGEANRLKLAKYELIVELCRHTEINEQGICRRAARYFQNGRLDIERVRMGYISSSAYEWLKNHPSLEVQYELSTILNEQSETVLEVVEDIRQRWLEDNYNNKRRRRDASPSAEPEPSLSPWTQPEPTQPEPTTQPVPTSQQLTLSLPESMDT